VSGKFASTSNSWSVFPANDLMKKSLCILLFYPSTVWWGRQRGRSYNQWHTWGRDWGAYRSGRSISHWQAQEI
jgi:hypothetical protein